MKRFPSGEVETIRERVEEATTKGFRSVDIDRATTVVAKQDQQEKVFAFFRSLPGAVVDYASSTSPDAVRRSNALKSDIVTLENTVEDLTTTVQTKAVISAAQSAQNGAGQVRGGPQRGGSPGQAVS
ncbi:unnamed protein product [Ectocarpus sp. 8 AP-2014]